MLRQDELIRALEEQMIDDQIESIAESLHAHSLDSVCGEIDPDTEEPQGLEFRLRLTPNGTLVTHIGDSSYDLDHRGFIASGWVPFQATFDDVKDVVSEVLEELRDNVLYPEEMHHEL